MMSPLSKYVLAFVAIGGIVFGLLFWWRRQSGRRALVSLFMAAFCAAMASLFLTTDVVHNAEELRHVEFGWPLTFVTQNQMQYGPPFPWPMKFAWELSGDEEHPAHNLDVLRLAGCIVFYVALFYLPARLMRRRYPIKEAT